MTDFTDLDKEQLELLRKALDRAAQTSPVKQPWQEHFSRNTTAKAGKSILASEIIKGFAGSWAASYNYGLGAGITASADNVRKADSDEVPVPIRAKTTKLGRRGLPDIDFVPYNWRTNRFGSKGPSLVGHPISYEVVGPTLKSPFCNWTWDVDLASGPNGGDELTMSVRPDGGAAVASTLAAGYGPDVPVFTMGGAGEPNGGLYVLIADDGANAGSIPAGATPMGALPEQIDTARYEIFRVVSARAGILELHPNKPLADYFDLAAPLPRTIRAITIIRPYVTRLAAIPGSGEGAGRERVFAVVSPETSASSDSYPPFDGGVVGDGSWLQGGFDGNPGSPPTAVAGSSPLYMGRQTLPIPIPLRKALGQVHTDPAALPPAPAADIGRYYVQDHPSTPILGSPSDVGLIMRIYNIESRDDTELTFGTPPACLGWFPIIDHQPGGGPSTGLIVSRTVEVDPTSGHTYFGPGPYLQGGSPQHDLVYSVHEPVSRLWDTDFFNIDKVEACRLKNLIDPSDVSRFEKQVSVGGGAGVSQPGGASFSGPDKAIWDTSTSPVVGGGPPNASNPGSLLDLGFRMVLFPAKDDGAGNPIPDFDNPLNTRGELVIDPASTDQQFLEVDYDGGVVRLSTAPPMAAGGEVIPNGIIGGAGTTNPRNEAVLFAACVPYSMEESQLGAGPRVVGNLNGEDLDVYSDRVFAGIDNVNTNGAGSAPFVGPSGVPPNPVEIVLDQIWDGPSSGVIEILDGGPTGASFGLWGYTETRDVVVGPDTVTALGGITSLPTTISDPSVGGADPRTVILRREVFFAEKSFSKDFGTDNSTNDTAYGSSQRAGALRFTDARVAAQPDGSVTVTRTPAAPPGTLGFEFFQFGHLGAAQGDASGVANTNDFSALGFFYPAAYDSTANGFGGPSATTGSYNNDLDGPYIEFSEPAIAYRGVAAATNLLGPNPAQSQIRLGTYIRLVVKFKYFNLADSVGFIGLVGTSNPGVTDADVNQTVAAAPNADLRIVGCRIPNGPGTEFEFVTQGSGGFNPISAISLDTNVHYFVLESSPDPAEPVKVALYDANFNLEADATVNDATLIPDVNQTLSFIGGVRGLGAAGGRPEIRIYFATAVLRYDLAKG